MGEHSPYRKISKKIPSPQIRGGGARQFSYQQFFRGKLKVKGLPPPLIYIYIFFFKYFFYKGIALTNKLVPSVLKSEENWAIDAISKKTSAPPPIFRSQTSSLKKKKRSIFLRLRKRRQKIVQKSNPLIDIYIKKISTMLGGRGGRARQFSYKHFFRDKKKI